MAELEQLKGKNWMATMALCWCLGMFGAHRFYTGKATSAWAMLVLSLIGLAPITYLWALVDGVTLATGKFTNADGGELYERVPWFGWTYVGLNIAGIIAAILYAGVILAVIMAAISGTPSGAGV